MPKVLCNDISTAILWYNKPNLLSLSSLIFPYSYILTWVKLVSGVGYIVTGFHVKKLLVLKPERKIIWNLIFFLQSTTKQGITPSSLLLVPLNLLLIFWILFLKIDCIYIAGVRTAILYGDETWTVKDDDVMRLECAEKTRVRWMCNTSMRDGPTNEEFRGRFRIGWIKETMRKGGLNWSHDV